MTTCSTPNTRTLYRGTVEYIGGTATADDVLTDDDTIAVSFDRTTWMDAEWVGAEGVSREWRILLGDTNPLPTVDGSFEVFLRITDNPEVPVIKAGDLTIA